MNGGVEGEIQRGLNGGINGGVGEWIRGPYSHAYIFLVLTSYVSCCSPSISARYALLEKLAALLFHGGEGGSGEREGG